jgi:hypothetical protein
MKNYGYKVCYIEDGQNSYTRHFLTYTKRQAQNAICGYIRYPPTAREDGHTLIKPKWKIIAVSKREVLDGIWRETPF